jgi:hypothetical protein
MRKAKPVNKKLRTFLGLWWIEPIEETLKDLGIVPYRHVPQEPLPAKVPPGIKPNIQRTGN